MPKPETIEKLLQIIGRMSFDRDVKNKMCQGIASLTEDEAMSIVVFFETAETEVSKLGLIIERLRKHTARAT